MVDQELAQQFFPGENAVGKRLTCDPDGDGNQYRWYEIVGVVATMKFYGADPTPPNPIIYFPLAQTYRTSLVLLVRSNQPSSALEKVIRETVASVDSRQPIYDVRGMPDRVAQTYATQRLLTFLLSVFAGLALLLASIGLYGVLSYNAVRRLREIALRLAHGASAGQIRGLIFGHGLRLLAAGCAIGLIGSVVCSNVLRSVLFEVRTAEPVIYLVVAGILSAATAIACWFPAQRAIRVDPIDTLRAE
jgi:putative ABC transport system permease protein